MLRGGVYEQSKYSYYTRPLISNVHEHNNIHIQQRQRCSTIWQYAIFLSKTPILVIHKYALFHRERRMTWWGASGAFVFRRTPFEQIQKTRQTKNLKKISLFGNLASVVITVLIISFTCTIKLKYEWKLVVAYFMVTFTSIDYLWPSVSYYLNNVTFRTQLITLHFGIKYECLTYIIWYHPPVTHIALKCELRASRFNIPFNLRV